MLLSGCRWKDAPAAYGPRKTLYNRFQRWAAKGIWADISSPCHRRRPACGGVDRLLCGEGTSLRLWRKRGEHCQAIGRSRRGRSTKIHALTDTYGRPIAFLLTGGQVADCTAADTLLEQLEGLKSSRATRVTTPMPCARKSRRMAQHPIFRPKSPGCGRTVSHRCSIAIVTPSSGCSIVSKTSAASRRAMIGWPPTSKLQSASLPQYASGYESQP